MEEETARYTPCARIPAMSVHLKCPIKKGDHVIYVRKRTGEPLFHQRPIPVPK